MAQADATFGGPGGSSVFVGDCVVWKLGSRTVLVDRAPGEIVGLDGVPVQGIVTEGYGARDNHVHSVRLEVHLLDLPSSRSEFSLYRGLGASILPEI